MNQSVRFILPGIVAACVVGIAGCSHSPPQVAPAEPPTLPVSKPVQREVQENADFTGRTDAVQAVDVRARVTGYLIKMPFKEGADVKKGDLLFEIDPRPYEAQLDQAQGQLALVKAQLKLAKLNYERDRRVAEKGFETAQKLDEDFATVEEATARIKAYEASLEIFKLNLSYTKVTSPIDGQVSRYYLTPGNLVIQDQTLLTTVVSLDPMYVYFELDEPTLLKIRRAINEGKIKRSQDGRYPIWMGLQGEDLYPHQGTIDFMNNQVNPATGSISVRGVFANPMPKQGGARLLSPGMFTRVRLPIGQPYSALLVIDRAIATDQGLKYVYVLGPDDDVQYRRVTIGPLQDDGLRVIADGLKPDDRVLVGGLQQVRPKMKVKPELVAMPSLGQPSQAEVSPASPSTADPKASPTGSDKR
jgi:multidrug efflux system membrane fusion protein